MTRRETLEKAMACVTTDRNSHYGTPENNFNRIADLWTAYFNNDDICFTATDVAAMMCLMKLSRVAASTQEEMFPTFDNWVDLAGYAACGAEVQSSEYSSIDILDRWDNLKIEKTKEG